MLGETMTGTFSVAPGVPESFATASTSMGEVIANAATVNAAAMMTAVGTAVGPIGVEFLIGYAPAQLANLTSSFLVSTGHLMMGAGTTGATVGTYVADGLA